MGTAARSIRKDSSIKIRSFQFSLVSESIRTLILVEAERSEERICTQHLQISLHLSVIIHVTLDVQVETTHVAMVGIYT